MFEATKPYGKAGEYPMFEAILPRHKLIDTRNINSRLRNELSSFAVDVLREAADYEVPPSLTYTRTNMLKGSWSKHGPRKKGNDFEVAVVSSGKIAPYNAYVRGPKKGKRHQAIHMAARGWQTITEIANHYWPATRKRLKRILACKR